MPDMTIRDNYGDPLSVNWYAGTSRVWLEADSSGHSTCLEFDRKAVKQIRRALKQFLRESKN